MVVKKQTPTAMDETSRAMLYEGCSLSQLCVLFGMDRRFLTEKLQGTLPSGTRFGHEIWRVRDVASKLVRPEADIEAYIKRMNHADLPKHLTKEFWAGLRSKQEYELKAGDLWPTVKIIEKVGELYKLVKMSVLLVDDAVERQTELNDRQRSIIKGLMMGMLEDLHRNIRENFKEPSHGYKDDDSL